MRTRTMDSITVGAYGDLRMSREKSALLSIGKQSYLAAADIVKRTTRSTTRMTARTTAQFGQVDHLRCMPVL